MTSWKIINVSDGGWGSLNNLLYTPDEGGGSEVDGDGVENESNRKNDLLESEDNY